jgi:Kelch motif
MLPSVVHPTQRSAHRSQPAGDEQWSLVQSTGTKPSARFCHATAVHGDNLYLYGGIGEESEIMDSDGDTHSSDGDDDGESALSDLFVFRLRAKSWLALAASDSLTVPGTRRGHSLSALGSSLILVGGSVSPTVYCYLTGSCCWVCCWVCC